MHLYQLFACLALISGAFVCVVVRSRDHATHIRVLVPLPRHNEEEGEPTPQARAWVQLWSMRKEGSLLRTVLYSNPLTAIKAPRAILLEQRPALWTTVVATHAVDHDGKSFVANCCDLSQKVDSTWTVRASGWGWGET